jgi:hypothetical protein
MSAGSPQARRLEVLPRPRWRPHPERQSLLPLLLTLLLACLAALAVPVARAQLAPGGACVRTPPPSPPSHPTPARTLCEGLGASLRILYDSGVLFTFYREMVAGDPGHGFDTPATRYLN